MAQKCDIDKFCGINALPNDVLLEIFLYLCPKELSRSVLHVCHKWYDIGNHPALWRKINFGIYCMAKLDLYLRVVKLHPTIRTIICVEAGKEFLENVVTLCPNLKELVVPQTVCVPGYTIKKIVAACPRIEFLDFSFNKQSYSLRNAFNHIISLKNLKTLKLISCDWVSSRFTSILTSGFTKLECLYLDCVFLPQEAIYDLLLKLKPTLKELSVKCEKLDNEMKEILHECHKLEVLKIKVLLGPINMQMSHLCPHQRQFKKLALSSCSERLLPPEVMRNVFRGTTFPNVTHLSVKQASGNDALAQDIACEFPRLQDLSLVCCGGLTNAGVKNIIQKCNHLEVLSVCFCERVKKDCFEQVLDSGRKSINVEFVYSILSVSENPLDRREFIVEKLLLRPLI